MVMLTYARNKHAYFYSSRGEVPNIVRAVGLHLNVRPTTPCVTICLILISRISKSGWLRTII